MRTASGSRPSPLQSTSTHTQDKRTDTENQRRISDLAKENEVCECEEHEVCYVSHKQVSGVTFDGCMGRVWCCATHSFELLHVGPIQRRPIEAKVFQHCALSSTLVVLDKHLNTNTQ